MATYTASASLKYWAGSAAAVSGQARSGYYNNVPYSGHIIFSVASLGDMANVNINNIKLTLTIGSLGGAYTKDIILTHSGRDVVVGTYSRAGCRNTTVTLTWSSGSAFNDLKNYFEGLTGGKAYLGVVSHGTSRGNGGQAYDYDYLNITAAQLELTYGLRKSIGSISAASTGSNATLKITSYDSSYTHRMTWKLGSWSSTTTTGAGVTTATCAIPHSALPNATSGTATVTLETLSGGTSLGSNTYSFEVSVPSSVVPSIGSFTATPVNSGASSTAAGWGLYIQNKTKASVAMGSVSAGSGATIKSYSITSSPNYGSGTASSLTSNLLTASGSVTFTAKVTDSRGRTATKTATITVQAYAAPVFTATPTIWRCNSSGTRDDIEGTYARLTASFSYSSVNSKNSLTVKKVVLNGATTNLTSGTAVTIGAGALAVDNSYSAVITLTDAVGSTTTFTLTVPSAAYVIHIRKGGKSVGIGKAAPVTNNKLEIAWPTDISGQLLVNGEVQAKPTTGRAYMRVMAQSDEHSDITFGYSNTSKWALSGRDSSAKFFGLYNYSTNNWVWRTNGDADDLVFATALPVSSGGTGQTTAANALAALGTPTNNAAWKNAPVGISHYRYESTTAASDYDLPNNYVHVLVLKYSSSRGIALAWRWSNSGTNGANTGAQWMNILHGSTWTGWVMTSYTFDKNENLVGTWTDGKPLYRYCNQYSSSSKGDISLGTLPRTPNEIISIRGAYYEPGDSVWRSLPWVTYGGIDRSVSCYVSGTAIKFFVGSALGSTTRKYKVIIEYTA